MTTADARRPALSAIPDLGFGAAYLAVWVLPGLVGAAVVSWLTLVIVLEAPALLAAYVLAMTIPPLTDGNVPSAHARGGAGADPPPRGCRRRGSRALPLLVAGGGTGGTAREPAWRGR